MDATPNRPLYRDQFAIAIICAVQPEWDAVKLLLDEPFENPGFSYGKLENDQNAYTAGRFGTQAVVLVRMPGIGIAAAAACAASLRMSFPGVKLTLLVGICGAAPCTPNHQDIFLGDVIIGTSVVQPFFGRLYPNRYERKDTVEETVGRASAEIRAFLGKVDYGVLRKRIRFYLAEHSKKDTAFLFPTAESDRLHPSDYQHMHQTPGSCSPDAPCTPMRNMAQCALRPDARRKKSAREVCKDASSKSCSDLGCVQGPLVRNRTRGVDEPWVHVGRIASSDSVIKSGIDRDRLVQREKVIAFEMESAGAWDYASLIVIKSACDYADSHKNNAWRQYASFTAAACTKALLEQWTPSSEFIVRTPSGMLEFLVSQTL